MKLRSKRSTLVMVGGLSALAFVLSASGVAMSTTYAYRTVAAGACAHATDESPSIIVIPGWACSLQAGTDNNGSPMTGQLASFYFDYYLFSATPTVELCVTKASFTGSMYADCITPSKPSTFPTYVDTYLTPINTKQNASVWDYLRADVLVFGDSLYPDYVPVDVRPLGVTYITGY